MANPKRDFRAAAASLGYAIPDASERKEREKKKRAGGKDAAPAPTPPAVPAKEPVVKPAAPNNGHPADAHDRENAGDGQNASPPEEPHAEPRPEPTKPATDPPTPRALEPKIKAKGEFVYCHRTEAKLELEMRLRRLKAQGAPVKGALSQTRLYNMGLQVLESLSDEELINLAASNYEDGRRGG